MLQQRVFMEDLEESSKGPKIRKISSLGQFVKFDQKFCILQTYKVSSGSVIVNPWYNKFHL